MHSRTDETQDKSLSDLVSHRMLSYSEQILDLGAAVFGDIASAVLIWETANLGGTPVIILWKVDWAGCFEACGSTGF